ncbi:MAG: glycosyltransferase [Peptococcia bacterium]
MKKCAFVVSDWFIHKTKSHKPFLDLFKKEYSVDLYEGLEWNSELPNRSIFETKYDLIVFFVRLPPSNQLVLLNCEKFVWIPMNDSFKGNLFVTLKYITYQGLDLKVVCFSRKLFGWLKFFFDCKYFQYYPKPCFKRKSFGKVNVLFWVRRKEITLENVLKVINLDFVNSLLVRFCPDVEMNFVKKDSNKIKFVSGWLSKKKYFGLFDSCNVFVAPRVSEGIGFSFLEAMARGLIVLGNNDSTMNEYVTDSVDGFLFNYKKPVCLNLGSFKLDLVKKNMEARFLAGYNRWCKDKLVLLDWVLE